MSRSPRTLAWTGFLTAFFESPQVVAADVAPLNSFPPRISFIDPLPGTINTLEAITVTFSEPVTGVLADDFLVNGVPATALAAAPDGTTFTFRFIPPSFGRVDISWGPLHQIRDRDEPSLAFDAGDPESSWSYDLVDINGPRILRQLPRPTATLRGLGEVEIWFNRPVEGLEASDLLLNGQPAQSLVGVGAGPFQFVFPQPAAAGPATLNWRADHGITGLAPGRPPFRPESWTYTVDPTTPLPDLVLNEVLAENLRGLKDEDGDPEDWIELRNRGSLPVSLGGWALSSEADSEDAWVFPAVTIPAQGLLLVRASGKNRADSGAELHTHFKLNSNGGRLELLSPELPRSVVDSLEYPRQAPDVSFARVVVNQQVVWRPLTPPSPGQINGASTLTNTTPEVYFSVERGFFDRPFRLSLACEEPLATIHYTTNGSPPFGPDSLIYSGPLTLSSHQVIRAAAVAPDQVPSRTRTHTYLFDLPAAQRTLPALSLVTSPSNLFGPTGIMETSPRNTTKHGPAWERPVSVEWIEPEDNGGFQVDAGLRLHGGDYIRARYNYRTNSLPESKYSFRLYFRGEYGTGRLEYPLFPNTTVGSFDTIVLRSGMNDHSNPFLRDELVRQLAADVGQPASHGTFVHLFLNGRYLGYYNPTERFDDDFLRDYHGGENWDLIAQQGQAREGNLESWRELMQVTTNSPSWTELSRRVDVTNFVDYLLPLLYVDADDWPNNNWRAAREAVPEGRWRFYVWDAEWSFGEPSGRQPNSNGANTLNRKLLSLGNRWEIPQLFNALMLSREFHFLFSDRLHRAFYNQGPLSDARIRSRYAETKQRLRATETVAEFNDQLITNWINRRRSSLLTHFSQSGLFRSSNAPVFTPYGGTVPVGTSLPLSNNSGRIFFTTDGSDPRAAFTDEINSSAQLYTNSLVITGPLHLKARSLDGTTNWSALAEGVFEVNTAGVSVRISEVMYHPPGGEDFEFVELWNAGSTAVDLSGYQFEGISFRFPVASPLLGPGERLILANNGNPTAFATRYPGVPVAGYFGSSLNNGGERLALQDALGWIVESVTYGDAGTWPATADGRGASLERVQFSGDARAPENWRASPQYGGTPGTAPTPGHQPSLRLTEINAGSAAGDWVELFNSGMSAVDLGGWALTDRVNPPRRFLFAPGTMLAAGTYLVIPCGSTNVAGLGTSFGLDAEGDGIWLLAPDGTLVDGLQFGPQAEGYSLGRSSPGEAWIVGQPTPGAATTPVETAGPESARLNELFAHSEDGSDWIELHNPTALPLVLTGGSLGTSQGTVRLSAPAVIGPGGFALFEANEEPGGNQLDFRLPAEGTTLRWLDASGIERDSVSYGSQNPGESFGRIPNGSGPWVTLAFNPTPGRSNYFPLPGWIIRFNEVVADSRSFLAPDGQPADWIELHNPNPDPVDLSGMALRVDSHPAWRFPVGISLPARGYRIIWATSRTLAAPALNLGQELFSHGGVVTLTDVQGQLLDRIEFGFQGVDQAIGYREEVWKFLSAGTPGQPNAPGLKLGSADSVRLNEWLAAPTLRQGADWIELFNPGSEAVDLGGFRLTDDPSLSGGTRFVIRPFTFLPARGYLRFGADDQADQDGNRIPFRLEALGETLQLLSPLGTLIDQVDFEVQRSGFSEGRLPDGSPHIVQLPAPSPAAPNAPVHFDLDGDTLPDEWELQYGLNPEDPTDAVADPDQDGRSNATEFAEGTNPRQPDSVPLVLQAELSEATVTLRLEARSGRSYRVEVLTGTLTDTAWQRIAEVPSEPQTREVKVTHKPDLSPAWYRVIQNP